jgi:hypothetical protein
LANLLDLSRIDKPTGAALCIPVLISGHGGRRRDDWGLITLSTQESSGPGSKLEPNDDREKLNRQDAQGRQVQNGLNPFSGSALSVAIMESRPRNIPTAQPTQGVVGRHDEEAVSSVCRFAVVQRLQSIAA